MRWNRFYLTGALLVCCWGAAQTALAQQTTAYAQPQTTFAEPLIVLNSRVIINSLLAEIPPADIKEVYVFKEANEQLPVQFRNLGAGIIIIQSSRRIKSQSFVKLSKRLGVKGLVLFALNGHPLGAPTVAGLRIAPAAIGQLHIIRPTAGQPATLVDVWLAPMPKSTPGKYPPGTIMIR